MEKVFDINSYTDVMFSLDIGTRNVVGTLSVKDDHRYVILDHEMMEHPDRAMYDGQIHDIEKVAKIAQKVKEKLEERNGIDLKKVAIAAAGRALKTARVHVNRTVDYTSEIAKDTIDNLEMEAIQLAQKEITPENSEQDVRYYCVGYSIISYYLDGSIIMNPRGHRGSELSVDLIATFLPHIVVDSLYSVMHSIGLEVVNMTLEPIAAINVAIPDNLRLLNLALIDVGAGTSDIAITKDGAIVSYGMVAMAGDAITETLAREYLLDYNTAEIVKKALKENDDVTFMDVVGITQTIKRSVILEKIAPTIKKITEEIGNKILEFNAKSPSAVFCIGGGCQIPGFTEQLADIISIPKERTVIKGTDMIPNLVFKGKRLEGPEFVTPIGIGFTAFKEKEHDFLQVTVNDKAVRLFNSRELVVSDALVLVGFNARNLIAKKSDGYIYYENGKEKRIYGDYGEPARIFINGSPASLDTKLKNKDFVNVEPARPGEDKHYALKDLIKQKNITFNHQTFGLIKNIKVNGRPTHEDYIIKENDVITYDGIDTLEMFMASYGTAYMDQDIFVNEGRVDRSYVLMENDVIETKRKIKLFDPLDEDESGDETLDVTEERLNMEFIEESKEKKETVEPKGDKLTLTVNGSPLTIEAKTPDLIFVDIFNYYYFDRSVSKGIIDLKLNGVRAKYTDPLKNGDMIEIGWR